MANGEKAEDGPCTTGRRTSLVLCMTVTTPAARKVAVTRFVARVAENPATEAMKMGSSQAFDTSACCSPNAKRRLAGMTSSTSPTTPSTASSSPIWA